jgi:serine/threonine-protein phosphatase PGAM5
MPLIWLIRHGDYEYMDPAPETIGQGLTTLGQEQAKYTARYLSELDEPPCKIICSDFLRAKETAEFIAAALPRAMLDVDPRFRECRDVYFKHRQEISKSAPKAYRRLFQSTMSNDAHTAVVCHANLIRYLLARLDNWTEERWESVLIGNCSISVVDFVTKSPPKKVLRAEASVVHLPPSLREQL